LKIYQVLLELDDEMWNLEVYTDDFNADEMACNFMAASRGEKWKSAHVGGMSCIGDDYLIKKPSVVYAEYGTGTLSRASSEYTARNNVSIIAVLNAIHIFHEAGRWTGHPYIELHPDGSGRVVQAVQMQKYMDDDTIFSFENLRELVEKADQLMKTHNIKRID